MAKHTVYQLTSGLKAGPMPKKAGQKPPERKRGRAKGTR